MFHINEKYKNQEEYVIASNTPTHVNLASIENFRPHLNLSDPNINFYPGQNEEFDQLLKEISDYTDVPKNCILITNGSGRALDMILNTFVRPETKILIPCPNYPGFVHSAELSPGQVIKLDNYSGTVKDTERLVDNVKQSNIIYISTPNLPMGYKADRETMIQLISENSDKLFIMDEAYYAYGGDKSYAPLVKKYKNLIVTRTFSKTFALAGARVGYAIADEFIIGKLRIGYNTKDLLHSSILQALDVMKNREYYLKNIQEDLKIKKWMNEELSKVTGSKYPIYGYQMAFGPWFLLFSKNPEHVKRVFYKNGYKVRNKNPEIKDCIRVTLCTMDHMIKVLDIVKEINGLGKYDTLIFDLDGTLRKDYKSDILPDIKNALDKLRKNHAIYIITDNTGSRQNIEDYLSRNEVPYDKLFTPITKDMNPENKDWFVYENMVYVNKFPCISYELMSAIETHKKICVVEDGDFTPSDELGYYPNIDIPYIGSFLKIIKNCPWETEIVMSGKQVMNLQDDSNIKEKKVLMIGDNPMDEKCAFNNSLCFLNVNDQDINTILSKL